MVKLWTVCYLLLSKWESWVSFKNSSKSTDSIWDAPLCHCPIPWFVTLKAPSRATGATHCPIPWFVTLKAPSGATGGKDPNVQHSNVFLVGPRQRWYKLRICNSFFGAYKATWGRLCPMMFNLDIQQGVLCSLLSSSDLKSCAAIEKTMRSAYKQTAAKLTNWKHPPSLSPFTLSLLDKK